jgi:hypothetical protein
MATFPADLWARFRAAVPPTFLSSPASDAKDEQARQYVKQFAAQCAFSLGPQWGAKNAGGGRPLSKDVVACREGSALIGFDMFSGLGENVTTVNPNPGAMTLPGDQVFVPVAPQDFIGGVVVDPGPGPMPVPGGSVVFTATGSNGLRYVTVEDGGGEQGQLVGKRPKGLATASRTQADIDQYGLAWQSLTIEPVDGGVALKLADFYATAWDTGGKMVFNRRIVGPGETWRLHQVDGGVAIQAYTGKFACIERDAQGNITGDINVNRDAPGAWETWSVSGSIGGASGSAVSAPALTEVRIVNGRWTQQIVGASMLYALGPSSDPRAALDESRALGFQIVRKFVGDLPQIGLSQSLALQRLPQSLAWCQERGLKVYASCGTNKDPGASWYRDCGDILRGYPDVVLMTEGSNEALQRGGWATPSKLREYVEQLPGFRVLSAPDGDRDISLDYVSNSAYAFHFRRDRPASDLAHFDAVCRQRNLAGLNQEPIGADETNQPGRRSNDVAFFGEMGAFNRKYGFAGFFHSEAGLNARTFGPVQRQAAEAFLRESFGG